MLACFPKSAEVDFTLLWVIGPIEMLCVDGVMTILSLPLSTCTTLIFLDVTILLVIIFLSKRDEVERSHRMCKKFVCTNFMKSCKISKTIEKIIQTNILWKLMIVGYNFSVNILYKRIFPLLFFCFYHNPKANNESVFLILKVNQGPQVAYFQMII